MNQNKEGIREAVAAVKAAYAASRLAPGLWYTSGLHLYDGSNQDVTIPQDGEALAALNKLFNLVDAETGG